MNTASIQALCRQISGNEGQFIEDVHAALNTVNIPLGQIGERLIAFTGMPTASAAWRELWLNGEALFANYNLTLVLNRFNVVLQ